MTDCPPRLRGDLSKWLCEINTGVYVGHVSGRVRDALWQRVCKHLQTGRATMVYSTNGEQKMKFRVHNTVWTPVDFDGIWLMRRPLPGANDVEDGLKPGFSKAARNLKAQRMQNRRAAVSAAPYVAIDLETTGLQAERDGVIELGAVRVKPDGSEESFSCLIHRGPPLPQSIVALTGITDEMLASEGISLRQALDRFLAFIGNDMLVGHNISFDMEFLRAACRETERPMPANRCQDLLNLARRKVDGVANYKLETLAVHFGLPPPAHRALADCQLVCALYRKLNE